MKLITSTSLLLSQWQGAPKFSGLIERFIATWQQLAGSLTASDQPDTPATELKPGDGDLERMLHVDTAVGVWLDYIGKRVGLDRPSVLVDQSETTFGYRDATATAPFDAAPFKGALSGVGRAPLNDTEFRQMIKARGVALTSRGNISSLRRAVEFIDPEADVVDNRDMTITVLTSRSTAIRRADTYGALPRAAGVRISVTDGRGFGLDKAGDGFDRVRFKDNE